MLIKTLLVGEHLVGKKKNNENYTNSNSHLMNDMAQTLSHVGHLNCESSVSVSITTDGAGGCTLSSDAAGTDVAL